MLRKRSIARLVALIIIVSLAALPSAAAPTATSPSLGDAASFTRFRWNIGHLAQQ